MSRPSTWRWSPSTARQSVISVTTQADSYKCSTRRPYRSREAPKCSGRLGRLYEMWQHQRLDLTVEAHVLKPEFQHLFSPQELDIARSRLREYGCEFPT